MGGGSEGRVDGNVGEEGREVGRRAKGFSWLR